MFYPVMNELKAEIVGRGLTMRDVAAGTGLTYDKLSRLINGYCSPDTKALGTVRAFLKQHDAATAQAQAETGGASACPGQGLPGTLRSVRHSI